MDALSAYCIIKYYNIKYDEIVSLNYDQYNDFISYIEKLNENDEVFFIDFSPNKEWVKLIEEKKINIKIWDHHGSINEKDSAYDLLSNWKYSKLNYYYDNTKSGAEIFYINFIKPELKQINKIVEYYLNLVTIYDTGKIDNPLFKEASNLNRLFWKMKSWGIKGLESYDYFVKSMTYKFDNLTEWKYNRLEEKKIQEDVNREKEIFNKLISGGTSTLKTRKDEKGNYFCIMRLRSKASGICNLLFDKYSKLMYCIVINEYDKENLKLSLRSRQGFNLTDLQEIHGHEGAAGYENVTNEICNDLWENKIHSFKYRLKD